jgi:O-antigen/teichoic acid export membrane protein
MQESKTLHFRSLIITNFRLLTDQVGKIKRGSNLLTLFAGQGVVAIGGLLYGKIVALYIKPDQFGTYSLQLAAMVFVYGGLVQPTIQAFKSALQRRPIQDVIRFYMGLLWRIYALAFVVLLGLVGLGLLSPALLLLLPGAALQSFFTLTSDYLNISFQYKKIALLSAVNPLLNLLLLLLMVGFWSGSQVSGLWICYALLYGGLAGLALHYARSLLPTFRFSISWVSLTNRTAFWQEWRLFITPLVPHSLSGWINNYLDRYIIAWLLLPTEVGYYAAGYGFGARIGVLASPLVSHLLPMVLTVKESGQESVSQINRIVFKHLLLFWSLALPVCLLLYLTRQSLGHLLLSVAYESAFLVIPLVAIAYVFLLSVQFLETKFYAYNRTTNVLITSSCGALFNVGFNLWLIPVGGIVGAAIATICSAGCQFVVALYLFNNTHS